MRNAVFVISNPAIASPQYVVPHKQGETNIIITSENQDLGMLDLEDSFKEDPTLKFRLAPTL
jgi:hypothetical protein